MVCTMVRALRACEHTENKTKRIDCMPTHSHTHTQTDSFDGCSHEIRVTVGEEGEECGEGAETSGEDDEEGQFLLRVD